MENLANPWFKPAIDDGMLAIGMKSDTPLQMIAVQGIGEYGRLAFENHDDLNGQAIDIAGDVLTPNEIATALSGAAGRDITHFQVPIEQVREFSEDFAAMLEWFDAVGYSADIEGNEKRFGIRATPFAEWVKTVSW